VKNKRKHNQDKDKRAYVIENNQKENKQMKEKESNWIKNGLT